MGFLFFLGYPWGLILQVAALIHFFRRRPASFWLFVIIFLGPLGALVYVIVEVIPDMGLLRESFETFPRRKRIRLLEAAILDNPSVGNYEELADLYLDERDFARARAGYDKAIALRGHSADAYYRRGVAAVELGDFAAAAADLEHVTEEDAGYDRHRALGLLAHACARTGRTEEAARLFEQATEVSTLSETYLNYATFLAGAGRGPEARRWAEKILAKKPTMPTYLRRRERPWFRKAAALIKRVRD